MSRRELGAKEMNEDVHALSCNREADLVSFLYGEISETEKANFQRHMHGCAECSNQLAEFTGVHNAISNWRDESILGSPAVAGRAANNVRKPSAIAALREFFHLSPVWLKGAVAVASLIFCLLAGLAIMRSRNTAPQPVATNQPAQSQPESNSSLERDVEKASAIKEQPALATAGENRSTIQSPKQNVMPRRVHVAAQRANKKQLLTKAERQELAADLRLIDSGRESDLELLSDRINQ